MARTLIDLENQTQTIGDGKILVGASGTGLPTAVTVSADITISNTGVAAIGSQVIVDGDVSLTAAIAGTKISPNFGSQAVTTSGNISATGSGTVTSAGLLTGSNGLTVSAGAVSLPAASVALAALAEAVLQADGGQLWTGNQNANSLYKMVNLADGTAAGDSVNKGQLDAATLGLSWKDSADVATTAVLSGTMIDDNGTPVTTERAYNTTAKTITWFAGEGPTSLDGGVSLVNGWRILVKDETSTSGPSTGEGRHYNGIYVRTSADVWTRASDADASAELEGAAIFVQRGTANGDKGYTQTTDSVVLDDSTTGRLVWVLFTSVAGDATTLDGFDSSEFLRSNVSDALTSGATLSVNSGAFIDFNVEGALKIGTVALTTTMAELNAIGTFVRSEYATDGGGASTLVDGVVTVAGGQVAFTLAGTPITGTVDVFLNGMFQDAGAGKDYTISGSVVTFAAAPLAGDKIIFKYRS